MDAFLFPSGRVGVRLARGAWVLALACAGAGWAQVVSVPAALLHHSEGSVAFAPKGEKEWTEADGRRALRRGDRVWTDQGSRAELLAGEHALRMDGGTQLSLDAVDDSATQLSLTRGSLAVSVGKLAPGEDFEIGTPNLALRARGSGEIRIDVDAQQATTRVSVMSGSVVVYGERGEAVDMAAGQRLTFRERSLAKAPTPAFTAVDDFDRWIVARGRGGETRAQPAAQPAVHPDVMARLHREREAQLRAEEKRMRAHARAAASSPTKIAQAVVVEPPVLHAPRLPAQAAAPQEDARARQQARRAQEEREQRQAQAAQAQAAKARREAQAEEARREAQERRLAQARRAQLARKLEQERRELQARRAQEDRRAALAAQAAERERRLQLARRAQHDKREAQALAEARRAADERRLLAARQQQLERLQEQARRDEQLAREQRQRREEQARREEQQRSEELARREERSRREDPARREEQARRDEEARYAWERRQRALAEQWRRDHEVWLRTQQPMPPSRPAPQGIPARRIS